jgi:glycosyltransferase involved in cell wall biosynthesis
MRTRLIESLNVADVVHLSKMPIEVQHSSIIWDIDELPPQFRQPIVPVISAEADDELDPLVRKWVDFARQCKFVACCSAFELSPLISNGVIIRNCYGELPLFTERQRSKVLLFVGHLGYPPNVEAVDYFYKCILPKLPPDFTLRIVGKKPTNRIYLSLLEALALDPRVRIHFDVPSCTQYYRDALAAVVPLLQGTGTRFKILEAFAHRCPVVTTSKGCEGHDVADNDHLLIRDAPKEFASACEQLYDDDGLSNRLIESGLEFLRQNNSQAALESSLFGHIDRLIPSLLAGKSHLQSHPGNK